MTIGVISDTHGYLDPKIAKIFDGVDHIFHGGDIGLPWIILELEQIAPVTAVLGNTDVGLHFKETELMLLANRKFLLHHIVDLRSPTDAIHRRITREAPDAVVFGHTHKPFCETRGGKLYFNPGYAGKQRFNLPRSVGILHCTEQEMTAEIRAL
jgi:putative phosphoesterase